MKSMTAYGSSKYSSDDFEINLEIKSLNSRFLDLSFSITKELQIYEAIIRSLICKNIFRGKVSIFLNFKDLRCSNNININKNKLLKYFEIYQTICNLTTNKLNFDRFINLEEILSFNLDYSENSLLKDTLIKLSNEALEVYLKSAIFEGNSMKDFLSSSLFKITISINQIKTKFSEFKSNAFNKLKNHLETTLANFIPETEISRVLFEASMYVEKSDISEEIIRLEAHIKKIENIIEENPMSIGKTLNFIYLEMHREINTIGSKFSSNSSFEDILLVKEEIEKSREVVQNIE